MPGPHPASLIEPPLTGRLFRLCGEEKKEQPMHACISRPALNFFPVPVPNFGSWVRRRRLELGVSLTRAASLAGIEKTA